MQCLAYAALTDHSDRTALARPLRVRSLRLLLLPPAAQFESVPTTASTLLSLFLKSTSISPETHSLSSRSRITYPATWLPPQCPHDLSTTTTPHIDTILPALPSLRFRPISNPISTHLDLTSRTLSLHHVHTNFSLISPRTCVPSSCPSPPSHPSHSPNFLPLTLPDGTISRRASVPAIHPATSGLEHLFSPALVCRWLCLSPSSQRLLSRFRSSSRPPRVAWSESSASSPRFELVSLDSTPTSATWDAFLPPATRSFRCVHSPPPA